MVGLTLTAAACLCALAAPTAEFWEADWCGACKLAKPAVIELQEQGWPIKIRDYDQHQAEAIRRKIRRLPEMIIVDGERDAARLEGVYSRERIKAWLSEHGALPPSRRRDTPTTH
jgi:thiol-disulfide isomerase/thioredoxin